MPFWNKKKGATTNGDGATPALESTPAPSTIKPTDPEDEDPLEEAIRPVATTATEDVEYPSGPKLFLLITSVFISMFLVALVSQYI